MPTRQEIAARAADAVENAAPFECFVGFDGFIDLILRPVAKRRSMAADDYEPMRTMADFAARVGAAAGKSTNIETVLVETRFGGNAPLLAGALGRLGLSVEFAGAVGASPGTRTPLHKAFEPFAQRCASVVTLGEPSTTACYEFADGKLMLNDRANVQAVTWDAVRSAYGPTGLTAALSRARLVAVVNWSLLGGTQGILEALARDVMPGLPRTPRRFFVDLADPSPRSAGDLSACLRTLGDMQRSGGGEVTLGLNLMEAEIVGGHLGVGCVAMGTLDAAAAEIRERLGLSCVVIHPREGAAAATAGERAWFDGPLCAQPRLSTGAGDHFNAGFAFAQVLGLPLPECLAVGTGLSGVYVREAESPGLGRLVSFLRELPRA
jgi:sugar/nucleoside kinase (ribokinase family)